MHPSFFLPASQLSAFPQSDEKCNSSKKNNSWKSVTRTRIVVQIFLYSLWVNIILWIEWKMSKIYCHYFAFFFSFLSGRRHKKTRSEKRWDPPSTFSEGKRSHQWDWLFCRKESCLLLLFLTRLPQVFQSTAWKMSLAIFSPIQILRHLGVVSQVAQSGNSRHILLCDFGCDSC